MSIPIRLGPTKEHSGNKILVKAIVTSAGTLKNAEGRERFRVWVGIPEKTMRGVYDKFEVGKFNGILDERQRLRFHCIDAPKDLLLSYNCNALTTSFLRKGETDLQKSIFK